MKKIRNKILISIVMCVVLVSLMVGTVNLIKGSMMLTSEANQRIQAIAEINANELENIIVGTEAITRSINSTVLATTNINKLKTNPKKYEEILNPIIKNIIKKNGNLIGTYVVFNSDILGEAYEIGYKNVVIDGKWQIKKVSHIMDETKDQIKGGWSNPYVEHTDKGASRKIVSYTEPIFKNGILIGAVRVDVNLDEFNEIVSNIKINNTGYAFLLNEKFDYILHKTLKNSDNLKTINNEKYRYITDKISEEGSGFIECSLDGEDKVLGYTHLLNGWIIVTSVAQDEILQGIKYLSFFNLVIIIIGIIISSKIAIHISKKISEPVVLASEFAEEIASGTLDKKLEISSNDETKTLSISLNKAAGNIRNLIDELKGTEEELIQQVDELKKSEEKISIIAYNNSVTNLPNRNYFMKNLPDILLKLKSESKTGALIYIDTDNFKRINDTLGHSAGDEFLKKVSRVLTDTFSNKLKENDLLCNMGGDEFLFFLSSIESNDEALVFAERILDVFRHSMKMEKDKKFHITASIGIAFYPCHGKDVETLLRNADTALNKAKNSGKDRFEIFSEEMNLKVLEKIEFENKLRLAVENNEFTVFYQPKVNTKTGKIVSMEALVRWIIPNSSEIIAPDKFIPLAEEMDLIIPIGEYVLREACKQNKAWQESGLKPVRVAVNLSARQLQESGLIEAIRDVLSETGLDAKWLEVEVTESILMSDFTSSINALKRIKDMGINIYLDDFGTGYSSLNYLRHLPINSIKIDKSFVDGLTVNSKDSFIAHSLIDLAHGIDLSVVAEGVENEEQFKLLKSYGCDEIQGYYFSKPLDAKDFEKLLKKE